MPEKTTLWVLWRLGSTIVISGLWLIVYFVNEFMHSGTTTVFPNIVQGNNFTSLPSGFLINTSGCRIPDLDPFDPSIRRFIFDEEDTKCEETYGMALVESNSTALFINESALPYYNIAHIDDLRCCYTPFWRVELKENESGKYPKDVDFQVRFSNTCTEFTKQVQVFDEFVKVQCVLTKHMTYTDFHAFTPIKTTSNRKVYNEPSNERVSVLILGVDTVSRLNLHRQMPSTLNFLVNNLSAIEFLGYNKVEDNTFLNLVPVLTGLSGEELKESCWPSQNAVFDDCNFVWNQYRAAGYKTAFAEDARSDGGVFSYLFQGFRKQPTDYYPRVFKWQAEEAIGFNRRKDSKLCLGSRKSLQVLLNYAYKFADSMKDDLSFGFIWGSSLTHDYLNLPQRGDEDHKQFLEKLFSKGTFNRTLLVFMSDHGMRWGGIRQTYQGYFEERLPFLFVAFPDWFGQRYTTAVTNLKDNSKKLTAPFDLHETLLDLVNLTRLETDVLKLRSQELSETRILPRGISLFLPIPEKRACKDAGIVDHWCTCHQSVSVSTDDVRVERAAKYLVSHINSLVKDYPRCAKLQLQKITNARGETATSHKTFVTSDGSVTDYTVTIETVPGQALFESTIRYNGNSFTIVGTVSRINLYGNQSSCVSHFKLRLYCYCI